MNVGTAGGEPHGTLFDRLTGEFCNLTDFLGGGWLLDAAFAHHIKAGRAVSDQTRDIDHGCQALYGIEIAAVGIPVPGQSGENGLLGNVLYGFHHASQEFTVFRAAGRKGDAAVAEQGRGHPMPGDGGERRVPADLCIQMSVHVDEAGCCRMTLGVDFLDTLGIYLAQSDNGVVFDGDVADVGCTAGTVNNVCVSYDQVVWHR